MTMTLTLPNKKTTSDGIEMAFISDIHLAHPRTSTHHIVNNLYKCLSEEFLADLHLLFFAGDVFDRLMNLPQEEVDAIQEWISDTLKLCAKHGVLVRVLEGTPSHDWRQSKQFVNINESIGRKADLRYWDKLGIEVIEKLGGLTVLYVPDEWNDDASVTLSQVKELLDIHGLKQVDVACMHGQFEYQLPIESVKSHCSNSYLKLVKHYIGIGHVHLRSERTSAATGITSHILAQGSFDRLSHGEEAPKGLYRCSIGKQNKHWFVKNKDARIYKTLDCREMSVEATIAKMVEYEDYPNESRFRLLISRGSVVQHGIRDIRKRFPQFVITTQMDELKVQEAVNKKEQQALVKPISITATNVGHLVAERLKRQGIDTSGDTGYVLSVLESYARS